MSSPSTSSPPTAPSFLVRLRARARRQDGEVLLPEDHWHAGDPRLADGSLALTGSDVPSPRAPVDRRRLTAVPEIDVREPTVLDLRPVDQPRGDGAVVRQGAFRRAAAPPVPQVPGPQPVPQQVPAPATEVWTETSTWLG